MKIIKSNTYPTPNKDKIYDCLANGIIGVGDVVYELYKYISDDEAGEVLTALGLDDVDLE